MENIRNILPEDETFLDYLRKNGFEDIRKLFETLADSLPKKTGFIGPRVADGMKGGQFMICTLHGTIDIPGYEHHEWITRLEEPIDFSSVREASRRIVAKIIGVLPEIKAKFDMLLEIRGLPSSVEK
jgi:hypothetical protein